jgi:hypothetical protein
VAKGGSFRSVRGEAAPGARQEFAFFFDTGPAKSTDLGFRVLVSSVNMGSLRKLDRLEAEYAQAQGLAEAEARAQGPADPAQIVDGLLASAQSQAERDAYGTLRNALASYADSVGQQQTLTTRNYVWSLLYNILGIRTNSLRIETAEVDVTKARADIARAEKAIASPDTLDSAKQSERAKLPKLKESLAEAEALLVVLNDSYQKQRVRYNNLLLQARDFPQELLFGQLEDVGRNIGTADSFSQEMRKCFDTVSRNLDVVVRQKRKPESIKRSDLELQTARK